MRTIRAFSSTNAVPGVDLRKGIHREPYEPSERPGLWMLFLAFTHFLPRWQAARR